MCSCLKDCPNCCAHFGNYFYSLCRDPENPKGSLKHCRPWAGDEAGAEVEVSSSDTGAAEVHAEDERADVDVAPLDYNDSECVLLLLSYRLPVIASACRSER